jgi:hypothetical protein
MIHFKRRMILGATLPYSLGTKLSTVQELER